MTGNVDTVRAALRAYVEQDRDAALALFALDFTFTSPQDDHLDRTAFFAQCFPTADRFLEHRVLHVVPVDEQTVFAQYEYLLASGQRFRNMEATTIRDGLIREVQVFFGGAV